MWNEQDTGWLPGREVQAVYCEVWAAARERGEYMSPERAFGQACELVRSVMKIREAASGRSRREGQHESYTGNS